MLLFCAGLVALWYHLRRFANYMDRTTLEAADYTVLVRGLPADADAAQVRQCGWGWCCSEVEAAGSELCWRADGRCGRPSWEDGCFHHTQYQTCGEFVCARRQ